jgi:ABC-type polysaccharide/polyol phosphate export permease
MLGTPPPSLLQLVLSIAAACVVLTFGLAVFRRAEPRFADTI